MLLPPINFIFKLLQQHSTVSIWLFEQLGIRIEGKIRVTILGTTLYISSDGLTLSCQGFDEFMNLVIDDAVEVKQATKADEEKRRELGATYSSRQSFRAILTVEIGQILLKGDNVSLIQALQ